MECLKLRLRGLKLFITLEKFIWKNLHLFGKKIKSAFKSSNFKKPKNCQNELLT